jgi:2,4-dichlorophenol 6-monooxygenase
VNARHSYPPGRLASGAQQVTDTCDVLVVGAGPVGATAALLLASYGIECAVVEPRREPQRHPAAHVLSTRSMEIWREIGLERDIRGFSAPMHELRCIAYCTTFAGPELGRVPLADLPDAQMDAIESISPTRSAHLPENVLEPLLWQRLRNSDRIKVHTGWQYHSHTDGPDGVAVTITDTTTGFRRTILARYLIAADGAASTVRRALRIRMEGPILQNMISVHFSADLEAFRRHRRGPVMWTHTAKGLGATIVHRPPEDLVIQIPYFPPFESVEDFPAAICRRHIVDAVGDPAVGVDIKSIQTWAMHAQVATNYRVGRVFLAGDAAHRFPPTGGLGLHTGVADVHNLVWKLAWVIAGGADEALLDTYERERRPVGTAATADSVADARIRFMPAPLTRGIGYSGDRHRERFQRRCAVTGGVIAGPFVEIAKARGEPKGLRSCCAHREIATDWHRPRSEQTVAGWLQNCAEPRAVAICSGHRSWVLRVVAEGMPDFSSQEPIVKDVNVGARHR